MIANSSLPHSGCIATSLAALGKFPSFVTVDLCVDPDTEGELDSMIQISPLPRVAFLSRNHNTAAVFRAYNDTDLGILTSQASFQGVLKLLYLKSRK